jgi:hypothetical protein
MAINLFTSRLTKENMWRLVTFCSFVAGAAIGWIYLYFAPYSKLSHYIFWVYPSGMAGLVMGFSQWNMIRRMHKYAYLWIPVMTIGVIASIGAALTFVVAVPAYLEGSFFDKVGGLLVLFTLIAPIALFIGPICQCLMVRYFVGESFSKDLFEICVGWVLAAFLPFVMFYLINLIDHRFRSNSLIPFFLYAIVLNIPSGLALADITKNVIYPLENHASTAIQT